MPKVAQPVSGRWRCQRRQEGAPLQGLSPQESTGDTRHVTPHGDPGNPLPTAVTVTAVSGELRAGASKHVTSEEAKGPQHGSVETGGKALGTLRVCGHIPKWNTTPGADWVAHRARRTGRGLDGRREVTPHGGSPPAKCHITRVAKAPRSCETEREFLA